MKIVVDTREQLPYDFSAWEDTEVLQGSLRTGDYSLAGMEDLIAVERKELSDLIGCLTHGRERFTAELERARGLDSFVLIVEATHDDIKNGNYRSKMSSNSAVQSLLSLQARYRLPIIYAGSREDAEKYCYHFLRHYNNKFFERVKKAG